jgi:hypothetical protein
LQPYGFKKNDAEGRRAYEGAFEKEKKTRLFKSLADLHHYYTKFSEWSHATITSLAFKSELIESDGDLNFLHQYFETNPKKLRPFITFALEASAAMEAAFFKSFSARLELLMISIWPADTACPGVSGALAARGET